jgi:Integrase zinc binding domain
LDEGKTDFGNVEEISRTKRSPMRRGRKRKVQSSTNKARGTPSPRRNKRGKHDDVAPDDEWDLKDTASSTGIAKINIALREEHRKKFEEENFTLEKTNSTSSKHHSEEKIKRCFRIMGGWEGCENREGVFSRPDIRLGQKLAKDFTVRTKSNGQGLQLVRKCHNEKGGYVMKLVVSNEEMFDYIYEAHEAVNHFSEKATLQEVARRRLWTVTADDVKNFVKNCPVCKQTRQDALENRHKKKGNEECK